MGDYNTIWESRNEWRGGNWLGCPEKFHCKSWQGPCQKKACHNHVSKHHSSPGLGVRQSRKCGKVWGRCTFWTDFQVYCTVLPWFWEVYYREISRFRSWAEQGDGQGLKREHLHNSCGPLAHPDHRISVVRYSNSPTFPTLPDWKIDCSLLKRRNDQMGKPSSYLDSEVCPCEGQPVCPFHRLSISPGLVLGVGVLWPSQCSEPMLSTTSLYLALKHIPCGTGRALAS